MSFILKITNPEGGTFTYDEDGLTAFTTKYQAALAVIRALPGIHPSISIRDAKIIGRDLNASPLGTQIPLASGFRFAIEEV